MSDYWANIVESIESTQVLQQFEDFDAVGLFTNPWFLVPLIGLVIYWIVKQEIKSIGILAVAIMVWVFIGSSYMDGLIDAKGFIQLNKILPIAGVGVAALAIVIYLLFIRSD